MVVEDIKILSASIQEYNKYIIDYENKVANIAKYIQVPPGTKIDEKARIHARGVYQHLIDMSKAYVSDCKRLVNLLTKSVLSPEKLKKKIRDNKFIIAQLEKAQKHIMSSGVIESDMWDRAFEMLEDIHYKIQIRQGEIMKYESLLGLESSLEPDYVVPDGKRRPRSRSKRKTYRKRSKRSKKLRNKLRRKSRSRC
jgi:hypothetical protein